MIEWIDARLSTLPEAWTPPALWAIAAALLALVLSFAGGWWWNARARTRSLIRELEQAREALAAGDFDRRVADSGDGELGALARRIHLLADEMQSRYLASILDPVTGAYLRPHFESTLEREVARATRRRESVAVLACELDDVPAAAATEDGHDRLLQACVQRWAGCLRETDLVGRFGRREFAFLLPTATLADARRVADRLVEALGAVSTPAGDVSVPCAIGLAVFPQRLTSRDLLRGAEQALRSARREGHGGVAIDAESDAPDAGVAACDGALAEAAEAAGAPGPAVESTPALEVSAAVAASPAPAPTFATRFEREERLPARAPMRPLDPVALLERGPCPDIGLPIGYTEGMAGLGFYKS